jgi:hypothetical protein
MSATPLAPLPIEMLTDASEHGFGAYLCQRHEGTEQPIIKILSKAFTGPQKRWAYNEIFTRLGIRKPKLYGYLDMTSGYHQIEIDLKSRKYTAFTTHNGVIPVETNANGSHDLWMPLSRADVQRTT